MHGSHGHRRNKQPLLLSSWPSHRKRRPGETEWLPSLSDRRSVERGREGIKRTLLFSPFCRTLFVAHATLEGFIGAGLPVGPLSLSPVITASGNSGKFRIISSLFFCARSRVTVALSPTD